MVYIVLLILVLLVLSVSILYNKLIKSRNFAQNAWAQIDVQLKRRYDLIPNLVETVKGYAAHEKQVFENVTQARAMATGAQNMDQRIQGENMLTGALDPCLRWLKLIPNFRLARIFLNLAQEEIVSTNKVSDFNEIDNSVKVQTADTRQVICASCGANIHVGAESGGECEYCGSHVIQG